MKLENFPRAQELNRKIEAIDDSIASIEKGRLSLCIKPPQLSTEAVPERYFYLNDDFEKRIREEYLENLRANKKKYTEEFENLGTMRNEREEYIQENAPYDVQDKNYTYNDMVAFAKNYASLPASEDEPGTKASLPTLDEETSMELILTKYHGHTREQWDDELSKEYPWNGLKELVRMTWNKAQGKHLFH